MIIVLSKFWQLTPMTDIKPLNPKLQISTLNIIQESKLQKIIRIIPQT